jgi:hypothetical protein
MDERLEASFVARHGKQIDYAVYPPDFYNRGLLWTYRVVTKARSKARTLGKGAWIRRYVTAVDRNTGKRSCEINRLWQWNGVKFVLILTEPEP